jgi:hypothetical protein
MSERALVYLTEPLVHRFFVMYEATGMVGEVGTYLLRSLLSEGRIRYQTVDPTSDGLHPRELLREGPTGLLVTTTKAGLHPENETRAFSITVRDDPAQTRSVLHAIAQAANDDRPEPPDLTPWHALQIWLSGGEHRVAIPYASWLAANTDTSAVRLRRDFGAMLHLIKAHAILHRATRKRDAAGRILATAADYTAVHQLVDSLMSESAKAEVSAYIAETVWVVALLETTTGQHVTRSKVARELGLDPTAAGRRLRAAVREGYLVRKGSTTRAHWTLGEPLPAQGSILPTPEALLAFLQGGNQGCQSGLQ